ncbi:MAG: DUF4468 domain-containing protein [Bacteroidota bacterium]
MKNLFLSLGLLLPLYSFAQDCTIPTKNDVFRIQEVVQVDSIKIDQLYRNGLLALTEMLNQPEEHIEFNNWQEGIIYARFATLVKHKRLLNEEDHYFYFSFRLEFKDQRYRTTIGYLEHVERNNQTFIQSCPNLITEESCGNGLAGITKKEWNKLRCLALDGVKTFQEKFHQNLIDAYQNSDW